mgnify:CR=1 FL=1
MEIQMLRESVLRHIEVNKQLLRKEIKSYSENKGDYSNCETVLNKIAI